MDFPQTAQSGRKKRQDKHSYLQTIIKNKQ
jgi:hypothetical protein